MDSKPQNTRKESASPAVKPRHSLQHRMWLWLLMAAAIPLLASMVIFHFWVYQYLANQHREHAQTQARTLAIALAGHMGKAWGRNQNSLLDTLSCDHRIAFVLVADAAGTPIQRRVIDPTAWDLYAPRQRRSTGPVSLDHYQVIPRFGKVSMNPLREELIVARAVVWNTSGGDNRQKSGSNRTLEGHVVLGVQDPVLSMLLRGYEGVQIALIILAAVLCLPVSRWVMNKWLRPLGDLVEATRWLATENKPAPVPVTTKDELGHLAVAFNAMAARLSASREALIEANEMLEQKVTQRTRELHETVRKLDQMASTDPLTGLSNRRAFAEFIEQSFKGSTADDSDLSCVMIDLDGFKPVNDILGHQAGDALLVLAATVLRENCRATDIAARLGGDEFVLLLPGTDQGTARVIANRVSKRFEEESAAMLGAVRDRPKVSMSMGLASLRSTWPTKGEELILQADRALYSAKESGKACLHVYADSVAA